jgi:hypothetical protein
VQALCAFAHLQPDTATIHAELADRIVGRHQPERAAAVVANGMHARVQDQVGMFSVLESQSEGIHARAI